MNAWFNLTEGETVTVDKFIKDLTAGKVQMTCPMKEKVTQESLDASSKCLMALAQEAQKTLLAGMMSRLAADSMTMSERIRTENAVAMLTAKMGALAARSLSGRVGLSA